MKPSHTILAFSMLIFFCFGCSVQKKLPGDSYKIINNELRMYEIRSSMDATGYMVERFGKWDEKIQDKKNIYIRHYLWKDKDLLENGSKYTVITSGIETPEEYFTSFKVIDSGGNSCFAANYKDSGLVTDFLTNALANHRSKKETFLMIKSGG